MKKVISLILILCMVMTTLPVYAEEAPIKYDKFIYTKEGDRNVIVDVEIPEKKPYTVSNYENEWAGRWEIELKVPYTGDGLVFDLGREALRGEERVGKLIIGEGFPTIPEGFCRDMPNLEEVVLPQSVKEIGDYAFSGCAKLATINLDGVQSIGMKAFEDTLINTEGNVTAETDTESSNDFITEETEATVTIKGYTDENVINLTVPGEINGKKVVLARGAFENYNSLETLTIGEGISEVPDSLCRECENLKEVNIPSGVTRLGRDAFASCYKLEKVNHNGTIKTIDDWCFASTALKEFDFTGVEFLGNRSFMSTKLEKVYLADLKDWDGIYSGDVDFTTGEHINAVYGHYPLKASEIELQNIGTPFMYCSNLKEVTIRYIEDGRREYKAFFLNCKNIEKVTYENFPAKVSAWEFYNTEVKTEDYPLPEGIEDMHKTGWIITQKKALRFVKPELSFTLYGTGEMVELYAERLGVSFGGIGKIYNIDPEGKFTYYWMGDTLHIEGEGAMPDFKMNYYDETGTYESFGSYSSFDKVVIGEGITQIGRAAFYSCYSLKELTIPESVKYIDEYAFYGCRSLKKVNILGNSLERIGNCAFLGCVELESIPLPDSLKYIDSAVFHGCFKLESVVIGDNVEYVYYNAFEYCRGAKELYIGKNMKGEMLNLSDFGSLEKIVVHEDNAFYTAVDNVLFNKDMTEILKFPAKSHVTEYTVPESVTKINYHAFEDCHNLYCVNLPDGVEPTNGAPQTMRFINDTIYAQYQKMEHDGDILYYKTGSGKDGDWVTFYEVRDLNGDKTFKMPEMFKNFATITIKPTVYLFDGIETVDVKVLDKIPMYLFYQSLVKNVILSDNLKEIVQMQFAGCVNLSHITLPEGLEKINRIAFCGAGLESIVIPSSVSYIGEVAFEGCAKLKTIVINEGNLKELGPGWSYVNSYTTWCFHNIADNAKVYLPRSLEKIGVNEFKNYEYGYRGMIRWLEMPENLTIFAPKGSPAAAWAEERGIWTDSTNLDAVKHLLNTNPVEGVNYDELYNYEEDSDSIKLVSYKGCEETVIIPNSINGKRVIEIKDYCFIANEHIKEVAIPETVWRIGHQAFDSCKNLKTVVILNPDCVISDFDDGTIMTQFGPARPHGSIMKFPSFFQCYDFKVYGYKNSTTDEYFDEVYYIGVVEGSDEAVKEDAEQSTEKVEDETVFYEHDNIKVTTSILEEAQNGPENLFDDDYVSYCVITTYNEEEPEYIQFDLGEVKNVKKLGLAFRFGDTRTTYFDIRVSSDGINYETVTPKRGNDQNNELQFFDINKDARYIRMYGYSNSQNKYWISITEAAVFVK